MSEHEKTSLESREFYLSDTVSNLTLCQSVEPHYRVEKALYLVKAELSILRETLREYRARAVKAAKSQPDEDGRVPEEQTLLKDTSQRGRVPEEQSQCSDKGYVPVYRREQSQCSSDDDGRVYGFDDEIQVRPVPENYPNGYNSEGYPLED